MENKKNTYMAIDIMKLYFCVCIIFLHSGAYTVLPHSYWVEKAMLRLAVPFFFVTSGFFLGAKLYNAQSDLENVKIVKNYCLRLLKPYIFFLMINILLNTVVLLYNGETLNNIICSTIQHCVFYPYGALWYIKASIVGAIMIAIGLKLFSGSLLQKNVKILAVSFLLYITALLCNNYYFVINDTIIAKAADYYMRFCLSSRNGVLVGCFMISIGLLCYPLFQKIKRSKATILVSLITIMLFIFELVLISKVKNVKDDGSLYVSHIFVSPLLLYVLLHIKNIRISESLSIRLRNLSTGMYLLHRPVLMLVSVMISDMLIKFVLTVVLSWIICVISYKSKNKVIAKLLM